jgi:hypothetical protein
VVSLSSPIRLAHCAHEALTTWSHLAASRYTTLTSYPPCSWYLLSPISHPCGELSLSSSTSGRPPNPRVLHLAVCDPCFTYFRAICEERTSCQLRVAGRRSDAELRGEMCVTWEAGCHLTGQGKQAHCRYRDGTRPRAVVEGRQRERGREYVVTPMLCQLLVTARVSGAELR